MSFWAHKKYVAKFQFFHMCKFKLGKKKKTIFDATNFHRSTVRRVLLKIYFYSHRGRERNLFRWKILYSDIINFFHKLPVVGARAENERSTKFIDPPGDARSDLKWNNALWINFALLFMHAKAFPSEILLWQENEFERLLLVDGVSSCLLNFVEFELWRNSDKNLNNVQHTFEVFPKHSPIAHQNDIKTTRNALTTQYATPPLSLVLWCSFEFSSEKWRH